jgi:hypothetical protein
MKGLLQTYSGIQECHYKNEHYSVRDNGAVLRHIQLSKRTRPSDNYWTFGKLNTKSGYLEIASVSIHRIVATAFHGEPPTKEHVVDHIDTNKQNNRPDNLRWVTRLENILLNPITARRIELICGSVEAFLANPAKFRDHFKEPNFAWMCTVSKEESQICITRMLSWAKSSNSFKGGTLGEWIFNRHIDKTTINILPMYIKSKTPNAAQTIIFTLEDKPNEYPSTPQKFEGDPLIAYHERLIVGAVFFRNHNGEYVVVKRGFASDKQSLYVMTRADYQYQEQNTGEWIPVPIGKLSASVFEKDLPHSLTEIVYKEGLFIHTKVETGFHPTEELELIYKESTEEHY